MPLPFPPEPPERPHGVVLWFLNFDLAWDIQIQRAPDDGTDNPDTSNAEIIDTVEGHTIRYVDERDAGSGPWHYRTRTALEGCTNGPWTDWQGADPKPIPVTLPDLPGFETVQVVKWEADQTSDSTSTATLEVVDFEQRATKLEYNLKRGQNASYDGWVTTWDTSTGAVGTDRTLTRSETVDLHVKHNTIIKARITFDAPEGGSKEIVTSALTMDRDRTAKLTAMTINVSANDGSTFIDATGDADTDKIYARVQAGSPPADPDGTETDSNSGEVAVAQQTLTNYDTDFDASVGDTVYAKARGEHVADSGDLGPVVSDQLDNPDFDAIAEVNTLSGSIDEPDGSVVVDAGGDDDVDTIYITVAENSDPVDPDGTESNTTAGEGVINARSGSVDTDLQIDEQSTAHIKARGANSGVLGPVKTARVERGRTDLISWELEDETSGGTGTATLRVEDPDLRVTALEFQEMVDAGAWNGSWITTWDTSTGTIGSSTSLVRGEDVPLVEKHNTGVKARITYTDLTGNSRTIIPAPVIFDVDLIAEVNTLTGAIDASDGSVVVDAGGDDDTDNIHVTVGENTDPSDPTAASNDGTIAGRSGSIDTGVTVAQGSTVHIKAVGEASDGTLGPVKQAKVTRGKGSVIEWNGTEDREAATGTAEANVIGPASYDIDFFEISPAGGTPTNIGNIDGLSDGDANDPFTVTASLHEKRNLLIQGIAQESGTSKIVASQLLAFDQNNIPAFQNIGVQVDSDGFITASILTDVDAVSWKIEFDYTADGTIDDTLSGDDSPGPVDISKVSPSTVPLDTTGEVTVTIYTQTGQSGNSRSKTLNASRTGGPTPIIDVFRKVDDTAATGSDCSAAGGSTPELWTVEWDIVNFNGGVHSLELEVWGDYDDDGAFARKIDAITPDNQTGDALQTDGDAEEFETDHARAGDIGETCSAAGLKAVLKVKNGTDVLARAETRSVTTGWWSCPDGACVAGTGE